MSNEFFTDDYTATIQKVVKEIVNDPDTYMGAKFLPSVAMPVSRVRTEVIEATGGMTEEHLPGTAPKNIQSFGTRVQEYRPPFYKESILWDEEKILFLRELGQNGTNQRGARQRIDLDIDRLNRRIEARIEYQRWRTIFDGGFSWMGKTVSFGLPAANREVPVGAVWSSDGISANNSANPIQDLRYWILGGSSAWRKYKITKIVMNPNTARWILDNANTRAYLTSFGANPQINSYDVNKTLQFLVPGLPEVEIYDGWYQNETVVNGKLTVSDAVYFIEDGYMFMECKLPGDEKIGEFVQTLNLSSGSIDSPAAGKFVLIEDNTQPGTKGGIGNPHIQIYGGVYGGVKLDRGFDVLTAKVIA